MSKHNTYLHRYCIISLISDIPCYIISSCSRFTSRFTIARWFGDCFYISSKYPRVAKEICRPMRVSNYMNMTCVMPLICFVHILSFAANQLAHFPTSDATCSMVPCQTVQHYIDNLLSLLCLNIIIPFTMLWTLNSHRIVYNRSLS